MGLRWLLIVLLGGINLLTVLIGVRVLHLRLVLFLILLHVSILVILISLHHQILPILSGLQNNILMKGFLVFFDVLFVKNLMNHISCRLNVIIHQYFPYPPQTLLHLLFPHVTLIQFLNDEFQLLCNQLFIFYLMGYILMLLRSLRFLINIQLINAMSITTTITILAHSLLKKGTKDCLVIAWFPVLRNLLTLSF